MALKNLCSRPKVARKHSNFTSCPVIIHEREVRRRNGKNFFRNEFLVTYARSKYSLASVKKDVETGLFFVPQKLLNDVPPKRLHVLRFVAQDHIETLFGFIDDFR